MRLRRDEQAAERHDAAVLEPDGFQLGLFSQQLDDRAADNGDAARIEQRRLLGIRLPFSLREIGGRPPVRDHLRLMNRHRAAGKHAKRLVGDFVAMAIGAMHHGLAPALLQSIDIGKLIANAGGENDAGGAQRFAIGKRQREHIPFPADVGRFALQLRHRPVEGELA